MYLLDANVFIQAARTYYAPDIAPGFWDWLLKQHDLGNIASIAQVKRELIAGKPGDFLSEWARTAPETFWLQPLSDAASSFQPLYHWATGPDRLFRDLAVTEFFAAADSYLVAEAHANAHSLVIFELSRPESKKQIFIPDACLALGVSFTNPFQIYRVLGLRFG